jgi:cytoskeletal protein CcmA (bactofilin family)
MWEHNDQQPSAIAKDGFAYFGKGVEFRGKLSFDGTIRIDGRLEGEIDTNGTIEVGDAAVLQGIIHVGTLINSGMIKGTITATNKVHLRKSSVLIGEVDTPLLSIEEGAHLQGLCNKGPCTCNTQESQDQGLGLATSQVPLQATIERETG